MNVGYVRVSTVEQNEDRQIEALKKYNIDKWYTEKISAKNTKRPKLKEMLDFVRKGDTIYIHDFSRLARNAKDLLDIVEQLTEKGVHLVSNKENIDSSTPTGKLMLTMIGAIAEFERANTLERQREGIELKKIEDAKRKSKGLPPKYYKGRKAISIDETKWNDLLEQYTSRKISKVEFAKQLDISRPTLDKLLADAQ